MVRLIYFAYNDTGEEGCTLSRTPTHEVRALATSLAVQATVGLSDVAAAATWANPTVFTDYYLRHVSGI